MKTALVLALLGAAAVPPAADQAPKSRADWAALRDATFTLSEGQTPIQLLREMNGLLGSPDPFLRDNVAYEAAARWIYTDGALSADEQREMLALWTGNLQAGIGEPSGDLVFRRSFSALNLSILAAWLATIPPRKTALWAQAPAIDPATYPEVQNLTLVLRAAYTTLSLDAARVPAGEPARASILATLGTLR